MKSYLEKLMEYNYWANGLILKNVEKLPTEQFLSEIPFFNSSLRNILAHAMFGEFLWLDRMQGKQMTVDEMRAFYRAEKYSTTKQISEDWFVLEGRMRAFLSALSDHQLENSFRYTRPDGVEFESRYVDIFTQLAFHGMQHRAECAAILTDLGHSPGNIDYIVYLRT